MDREQNFFGHKNLKQISGLTFHLIFHRFSPFKCRLVA